MSRLALLPISLPPQAPGYIGLVTKAIVPVYADALNNPLYDTDPAGLFVLKGDMYELV